MEYFNAPAAPLRRSQVLLRRRPSAALYLALWGRKRRVLRDGRAYRDYFTMRMQFDTTNAERLLEPAGIRPPPGARLPRPALQLLRRQRMGPQAGLRPMNIVQSFRLSRDRSVTVANLVDELLRRNGDCEVSIEDDGPYHLARIARRRLRQWMRFSAAPSHCKPGQPVAIYRTNDRPCFHWFLAIIRAGGIAVPLNPHALAHRSPADSRRERHRILVTDKTVFERSIVSRSALDVRTWIQADGETETLAGFLRVRAKRMRRCRLPLSIRPQPSRSSTPLAQADFPRAPRFPAARCLARVLPP